MSALKTVHRVLPPLWAGMLLCIALIATPAPFATLAQNEAGRVVGHIFLREAYASLVFAVAFVMLERRVTGASRPSTPMLLALAAIFCTVAGYFGLQPMMAAAKAGQAGALSFGQLHAISLGFFGAKVIAVLVLAWKVAGSSVPGHGSQP